MDTFADTSVRLFSVPGSAGTTVVSGMLAATVFPRHSHKSYVVGAVQSGERAIDTFAAAPEKKAIPGSLFLLGPHQPHACSVSHGHGYCAVCVEPQRMERAAQAAWGARAQVRFDAAVVRDERLAAKVIGFSRLAEQGIATAGNLDALLASIVSRHGRPLPGTSVHPAARRAHRALDQDAHGPRLTLEELAERAHLSPFHLQRVFSRDFGVSPQRYQQQQRVRLALELLLDGVPPAQTAQRAGFADQSHLSRVFRSLMGVPPARFARQNR